MASKKTTTKSRVKTTTTSTTTKPKSTTSTTTSNRNLLTFETLRERALTVTEVEVPNLGASVLHLPVPADDIIELMDDDEVTDKDRAARIIRILSQILVKEDGSPMATEADLRTIPMPILTDMLNAITDSGKDEGDED